MQEQPALPSLRWRGSSWREAMPLPRRSPRRGRRPRPPGRPDRHRGLQGPRGAAGREGLGLRAARAAGRRSRPQFRPDRCRASGAGGALPGAPMQRTFAPAEGLWIARHPSRARPRAGAWKGPARSRIVPQCTIATPGRPTTFQRLLHAAPLASLSCMKRGTAPTAVGAFRGPPLRSRGLTYVKSCRRRDLVRAAVHRGTAALPGGTPRSLR